jgi:hypothetical protein
VLSLLAFYQHPKKKYKTLTQKKKNALSNLSCTSKEAAAHCKKDANAVKEHGKVLSFTCFTGTKVEILTLRTDLCG